MSDGTSREVAGELYEVEINVIDMTGSSNRVREATFNVRAESENKATDKAFSKSHEEVPGKDHFLISVQEMSDREPTEELQE